MTYSEYLKSNGATDADIAVLDTPVGRKAYEAMEARVATAAAEVETAKTDRTNLEKWFKEDATPYVTNVEAAATLAKANEARALAIVRDLETRGMLSKEDLQKFGIDPVAAAPAPGGTPAVPANTSEFLTLKSIQPALDSVGNNLAAMQDLVLEHMQLFPNVHLEVRALRNEANAQGKTVYEYWEQKYKVADARKAAADLRQKTHDDAMRAEGRKAAETELISKFGNPDTRPLAPSESPLAFRSSGDRSGKQPWEVGTPESLSSERVGRVATKVMQGGLTH
jgi:hypothetical protein